MRHFISLYFLALIFMDLTVWQTPSNTTRQTIVIILYILLQIPFLFKKSSQSRPGDQISAIRIPMHQTTQFPSPLRCGNCDFHAKSAGTTIKINRYYTRAKPRYEKKILMNWSRATDLFPIHWSLLCELLFRNNKRDFARHVWKMCIFFFHTNSIFF